MPRTAGRDLRAVLVATTLEIVEAEGAEAVTIARVAQACEVSVAAPYHHVRGRAGLLAAVADEGFALLGAEMAAARSGAPRQRLVEAGVAYVSFAVAHPHLFRLMFDASARGPAGRAAPAVLGELSALLEPLELLVSRKVALRTAWALVHGAAMLRVGGMRAVVDDDSPQRVREELEALLSGLLRR